MNFAPRASSRPLLPAAPGPLFDLGEFTLTGMMASLESSISEHLPVKRQMDPSGPRSRLDWRISCFAARERTASASSLAPVVDRGIIRTDETLIQLRENDIRFWRPGPVSHGEVTREPTKANAGTRLRATMPSVCIARRMPDAALHFNQAFC